MSEDLGRAVLYLDADGGKLQSSLRSAQRQADSFVARSTRGFGRLAKTAGIVTAGVAAIGTVATVKAGFGFNQMRQQAEIAFTTMLGSGKKARAFLDDLQSFAAKTPFEFSGLVESSQKLLAMGFTAKEVIPTMTAIGDAVAALGGNAGTLDRVTIALGQIKAKGKASAEEMLQLTEAGIPAWQMLADKIGTTVPEAMKLVSKGAIDSKTTIDAVTKGIEQRFGGMMEKQSHTFSGLWSTVKDTFTQISGTVMKPFFDLATAGLERIVKRLPAIQKGIRKFMSAPIHAKLNMVWDGLASMGRGLARKVHDLLFGSFVKGGGVGPEGIRFRQGLVSQMQDAVSAINWATIWSKSAGIAEGLAARLREVDWTSVGSTIGDGISDAISKTLSAGKKLAEAVNRMVEAIEWETLGRAMGPGLATAIAMAFATLMDPAFWARNWDLALAIAVAAFPVGKFAAPLGRLLAKPFGDALIAIAGLIERLSPKLAAAFLKGVTAIPGLLSAVLSPLTSRLGSIFDRLGSIAKFTIKVLGIDAVIQAVAGLARTVGGMFARLGGSIGSALNTAWEKLKEGALRAALVIVEPFSHLPGFLGGWARKAKDAINVELGKARMDAAIRALLADAPKMRETGRVTARAAAAGWVDVLPEARAAGSKGGQAAADGVRGKANEAKAAGTTVGAAAAQGVSQGIYAWLPQSVAAGVALVNQTIGAMRSAADANSPSKKTEKLGKDMAEGTIIGFAGGMLAAAPRFAAAVRERITALATTIRESRATMMAAFKSLALDALSAFDQAMSDWTPPSQKILDQMQREDAQKAAEDAVTNAANALQTAQNKLAADQAAGPAEGQTPEDFANQIAQDQAEIATQQESFAQAQRAYEEFLLQQQAEIEQRGHDMKMARDRENLAGELLQLQTELAKHPEEYDKIQKKILKLLAKYHVPLHDAGKLLASKFADGFSEGIEEVVKAARKLANALEGIPGVGKQGGDNGGGSGQPHVGGKFARGGIVTRPTIAMVGEAGPEAIIPLSGRHGMNATAAPTGDIVLQVDGETFARISLKHLDRYMQNNGRPLLVRTA